MLTVTIASARGQGLEGEAGADGDIICGPRCLRLLLEFYGRGKGVELLEVVREVQWPEIDKGASMTKLEGYLQHNGIATKALKLSDGAAIDWPYPVIANLNVPGHELGHYVVLLPGSDRLTARVWSGLRGLESMPAWHFAERTRGVLLTSPTPIAEWEKAVVLSWDGLAERSAVAIFTVLLFVLTAGGAGCVLSVRAMRENGPLGLQHHLQAGGGTARQSVPLPSK